MVSPLSCAPPAALRAEQLAEPGSVNHPRLGTSLLPAGDRDGIVGETVNETRGSVDGVDHPAPGGTPGGPAGLLAEDAVFRITPPNRIDQKLFDPAVDLGHHIGRRPLGVNLPGSQMCAAFNRNPPCFSGDLFDEFEHDRPPTTVRCGADQAAVRRRSSGSGPESARTPPPSASAGRRC